MNSRRLAGVSAVFLALVVFTWGGGKNWLMSQFSGHTVGVLPDLVLPDREGTQHSLQEFKGQKLLIHFWAVWCPPCLEELPHLIEFVKSHPELPYKVLAISLDASWAEANRVIPAGELPAQLLFLLDAQGLSAQRLGSFQYPETYLLNEQGKVTHKLIGPQNWKSKELQDLVLERH